jgi:hypothetical protein
VMLEAKVGNNGIIRKRQHSIASSPTTSLRFRIGLPSKFGALSHARSEARSCRGPYRRKTGQKIETPKLN